MFDGHQTVLVVAAHADDEALFFGGTLLRLHADHHQLHIAVLTGVQHCNPPTTDEQRAREPARQACRLGALARVCMDVGAVLHYLDLPQVACDPSARVCGWEAMHQLLHTVQPDMIITHGAHGDYSDRGDGWAVARAQHQLAYNLCSKLMVRPLFVVSRDGPHVIPVDLPAKHRLLGYYKYGCTQTREWDATREYPEWANAPCERYKMLV